MSDSVDTGITMRESRGATGVAMDSADLLTAVESGCVPAMPLLMQASRLARDLGALRIEQWLEWEMRGYEGADDLARQLLRYTKRWVDEAKGTAITDPLPAIEARIESLKTSLRNLGITEGDNAPFADKSAVFFDNAASDAVRQVAVEMQQITAQLNRLIIVHANAMAMLHAFSDNAFAQHKHLLPEGFTVARAPVAVDGEDGGAALPTWESANEGDSPERDGGLGGVPITDRDADGFDSVTESESEKEEDSESSVATMEAPEGDDVDTESLLNDLDIQAEPETAVDTADEPAGDPIEDIADDDSDIAAAARVASDVDVDSDGVGDATDADNGDAMAEDLDAIEALLASSDEYGSESVIEVSDGLHNDSEESSVTDYNKDVRAETSGVAEPETSGIEDKGDIEPEEELPSAEAGDDYEAMLSELADALEDSIAEEEEAPDAPGLDAETEQTTDSESDGEDDVEVRDSVLDIMKSTAPNVAGSIHSAETALKRGTKGAAAQVVRTMRSALNSIADHVFPAAEDFVTIENRTIRVDANRPLNRLFAHAYALGDHSAQGRQARKALLKLYWNLDTDMHTALDENRARDLMNQTYRAILQLTPRPAEA